jgi:Na+/proline symporter
MTQASLQGFMALTAPALFAAAVAAFVWRGQRNTTESFYVANRDIGSFVGAISIGIAWLWVFALFVGPQKAYQDGFPALLWFVIPNTLAIALCCAIAWQIRKRMGGVGCTLPEFHGRAFNPSMRGVSAFGIILVQGVYAVLAQLIGAQLLLSTATDISPVVIVLTLAFLMVALASYRGLPNSISADVLKAALIATIVFLTVAALLSTPGSVAEGLQGVREKPYGFFDHELLVGFALPVSISLLAGGAIDQQLYQRAYALTSKGAGWALVLAPVFFFVLCIGIGSLGFLAVSIGLKVSNPQLIGFEVMRTMFSESMGTVFVLTVASILIATGAAALNAVSSIGAIDVARSFKPDLGETSMLWISRGVMALFVVICVAIFMLHPTIRLLDLILFIGPFRVGLLLPTILAAYTVAVVRPSNAFTWVIIGAMLLGVWMSSGLWPLYSFSNKWVFEAGLTTLGITALACAVEWLRSRRISL